MGPLDELERREAEQAALNARWARSLAERADRVLAPPGDDIGPLIDDILKRTRLRPRVLLIEDPDGRTRYLDREGLVGRLNRLGVTYPHRGPAAPPGFKYSWSHIFGTVGRPVDRRRNGRWWARYAKFQEALRAFEDKRSDWAFEEAKKRGAREVRGLHLREWKEGMHRGEYWETLDLVIALDNEQTLACLTHPDPKSLGEPHRQMHYLIELTREWLRKHS